MSNVLDYDSTIGKIIYRDKPNRNNKTSMIRGIHFTGGKWVVEITIGSKHRVGRFDTLDKAIEERNRFLINVLNFKLS
jgi:DNA-binding HxlR family transcriptional regulator